MRESDPTKFSPLPLQEVKEVGRTEYRNYPVVLSEGVTYVELPAGEKYGSIEQLTSRMFKGILNVADVVEGTGELKGRFFSKVMPLDAVEASSTQDDIQADIAVLSGICADPDRGFDLMSSGRYSTKNVIFNGRVAAYYDFSGFRPNLFDGTPLTLNYARYTDVTLRRMKEKINLLEERIGGGEGASFLRVICKDIDMDSVPHPLDHDITLVEEVVARLQDSLLKKIKKMRDKIVAEEEKRSKELV